MEDLLNIGQALGRSEMKKLMAGSGDDYCGNMYCNVGGEQIWVGSGCGDEVWDMAFANCELEATLRGTTCNGCTQFP